MESAGLDTPDAHPLGTTVTAPAVPLELVTLHDAPSGTGIHHRAFHGGEGRENVEPLGGERAVAAAAGPDGHGRWDLLMPLSWKTGKMRH